MIEISLVLHSHIVYMLMSSAIAHLFLSVCNWDGDESVETMKVELMLSTISHLFHSIDTGVGDVSLEDYDHSVNFQCDLISVSLLRYLG